MGRSWEDNDEDADWDVRMARNLLIELVGGEQGAELRKQYAVT